MRNKYIDLRIFIIKNRKQENKERERESGIK